MPKERNKADDYREKAYAGDTKAMNDLGVCYERGTGVKVSLELAFEWYMKAAELGDVYGIDKWRSTSGRLLPTGRKKAKQGSWRISEATLLILAAIGGSIGALLGMKIWHHKTQHKKFKYGLPLILLVQIATIYFIS